MIKSIIAAGLLLSIAAPAAEAGHRHRRNRNVPQSSYVFVAPWGISWGHHPRQPKVRINQNCVWKPWSNRTVCRY